MRPRQDITEMFSSFLELENDRFRRWFVDIKLRRSIQNCLDCSPEVPKQENFWALYWHKHWEYTKHNGLNISESNHLAKMHLLAYLQEPCYHVSLKKITQLANSQYGLADYFQMANTEVEVILKDFDPRKSSSLKAYFIMAIKRRLRDILRQRKEADPCSNWALLRKISKKLYVEALENAGLSASEIGQYRLAWICFRKLYVQKQLGATELLPTPTPQLWQGIANLYNHSRHQLNQPTPECTAQIMEDWLNRSVKYVRSYLFPSVKSLDTLITFNPENDASQAIDLPDPSSESLITDMIAREAIQDRQNQISQMFGVLSNTLQTLDTKSQEILRLYYQEELTQQQIMQQLQISQPTVSRQLVKVRESLLLALVKWSQDLNISINPNQIKDMSIALEEWLRNQFGFNMNP
ncbi:sigma-70 family RNA polymerase sigma factor [Rivularia sp. UHCC 0363]|uniref:sigma-70 family RNA polymerase sigma factor n=1 Tax=Rivularia sp. UHCC 0363 TaxID=3110244 RepID=UPI002B1F9701|nr:sigma-70 family RNA polymerase sigma factor [Rivularia sp. UHCC 0363]MEA5598408.1 sigma-70 family RNA polymerase sigma factor [Rivularia sp. UHCC 0363]